MMHGLKPVVSSSHSATYQEREPPPYPGNNFQGWFEPGQYSTRWVVIPHSSHPFPTGLRQSYSGSEASTDFSLSSTESLSARQEPQGQETASLVSTPSLDGDSPFSEHLISPLSACLDNLKNSSAIFTMGGGGLSTPQATEPEQQRSSRGSSPSVVNSKGSRTPPPYHQHMAMKNEAALQQSLQVPGVTPNVSPQNSIKGSPVTQNNISLEKLKQFQSEQLLRSHGGDSMRSTKSASPTPQQMEPMKPRGQSQRPSTAPTQHPAPLPLPPPNHELQLQGRAMRQNSLPEENRQVRSMRRSFEMLDRLPQTHSQPDLSRLRNDTTALTANHQTLLNPQQQQPMQFLQQQQQQQQQQLLLMQRQHSQSKQKLPELDHAAIATRATQMVERLSQENLALRKELHTYYKKVCKLQKFDGEIDKIHRAYESLVKHSQKREMLEKAMRMKLESTIQTLNATNQQLREQLDKAVQHINNGEEYEPDVKLELQRKDSMLSKVIAQNRDILMAKERLQLEVANQRSNINEQRSKIALLDDALTQAQSNAAIQEEQSQDDTVASWQKAFCLLQTVSTQSGGIDQQLRAKLQEEMHVANSNNQQQQQQNCRTLDADEGIASDSESPTSLPNLMQLLQQKEQRILMLETQVQNIVTAVVQVQIKTQKASGKKCSRSWLRRPLYSGLCSLAQNN
ncbi:hypothetical protein CAPTEDRAFT_228360 [Capitella teleta]|uniref:Angiomotin C-terminal domain-containing protein n=1 Tax=Capitella teleta TaxID=283909 RepID=R7VKL8_CAPTE|nr:hypothetical protein CAPTEDRAFT_228360 [Capitella teleta]|eukprot:ELU17491.1 hypothetical protein CAPTEDRAFT_228360 [Capitella teleta]